MVRATITLKCETPEELTAALKGLAGASSPVPVEEVPIHISPADVEALLRATDLGKPHTIKEIRAMTGIGLKDAKDLYERVWPITAQNF